MQCKINSSVYMVLICCVRLLHALQLHSSLTQVCTYFLSPKYNAVFPLNIKNDNEPFLVCSGVYIALCY